MINYSKTSFTKVLLLISLAVLQVVTDSRLVITGRVVGVDDLAVAVRSVTNTVRELTTSSSSDGKFQNQGELGEQLDITMIGYASKRHSVTTLTGNTI